MEVMHLRQYRPRLRLRVPRDSSCPSTATTEKTQANLPMNPHSAKQKKAMAVVTVRPSLAQPPAVVLYRQPREHRRPMISSYLHLRPTTRPRTRHHHRRRPQNHHPNLVQAPPTMPNRRKLDACRRPIPVCLQHLRPWLDPNQRLLAIHRPTPPAPTAARIDPDNMYRQINDTTKINCNSHPCLDEAAERHHQVCPTNQHRRSYPPSRVSRSHRDCLQPSHRRGRSHRVDRRLRLPGISSSPGGEVGSNRLASPS